MNEGPGHGTLRGEPGRRAPLLGTLKDMTRKAQEPGISLHRGPVGEAGWGFPRRETLRDSS
jgi:hypothetical protein